MDRLVFPFLALALQWFQPRYNAQLQFLEAQIRILRSRVDASCIVPNPKEKAELLRLGTLLEHDISEVMHVVRHETYRKWVLQSKRGILSLLKTHPIRSIPCAERSLMVTTGWELGPRLLSR